MYLFQYLKAMFKFQKYSNHLCEKKKTCLNRPVFSFIAKNMGKLMVFSMLCDDTKLVLTTMNYNDNCAKHSWPTNILVWVFVFRSLGDGRKMRSLQRVAENWGFGFWRNFFLHTKIKKKVFKFFFSSSNSGHKRLSIFPKKSNIYQISSEICLLCKKVTK